MGGRRMESATQQFKRTGEKEIVLLKHMMNYIRKLSQWRMSTKKNVPCSSRNGKREEIFDEKIWNASEAQATMQSWNHEQIICSLASAKDFEKAGREIGDLMCAQGQSGAQQASHEKPWLGLCVEALQACRSMVNTTQIRMKRGPRLTQVDRTMT